MCTLIHSLCVLFSLVPYNAILETSASLFNIAIIYWMSIHFMEEPIFRTLCMKRMSCTVILLASRFHVSPFRRCPYGWLSNTWTNVHMQPGSWTSLTFTIPADKLVCCQRWIDAPWNSIPLFTKERSSLCSCNLRNKCFMLHGIRAVWLLETLIIRIMIQKISSKNDVVHFCASQIFVVIWVDKYPGSRCAVLQTEPSKLYPCHYKTSFVLTRVTCRLLPQRSDVHRCFASRKRGPGNRTTNVQRIWNTNEPKSFSCGLPRTNSWAWRKNPFPTSPWATSSVRP